MFKDYYHITGIILKNSFRKGGGKNKKLIMIIAFLGGMLPLILLLSIGAYQLTPKIIEAGIFMEFEVLIMTLSQFTIFFFGIFSILAYMFFSDDAEFLAALPVRKSSLFLSKLTMVYINELIVSALVLIPMLFITGISAANHGFDLSFIYFVLAVLAVFVMPIIPLLLVSLLAFPLMYVVSFFRRRAVLSSVVLILLFITFMGLYLNVVNGFASRGDTPAIEIGEQFAKSLTRVTDIAFFNTFYSKAMLLEGNFFLNFGIFVMIITASFTLTVLIAAPLFHNSVMAQLEALKNTNKKGKIYGKQDIAKAFLIKDFKMLVRNPGFAFQSFMGPILTPIMILFLSKNFQIPIEETGQQITTLMTTAFILFFMTMLLCGTNFVSAVAFTREGKFFYFNKYLPIPYKEMIRGKMYLSIISALIGVVLGTIVFAVSVKVNIINIFLFLASMTVMNIGFVYLGLYRDLKKPKLEWNNVNEAVKQNFNAMVPMFFGGGIGLVIMIIGMVIEKLTGTGSFLSWLLLWVIVFIPSFVIYGYYKQKLDNNYVDIFNNIEL